MSESKQTRRFCKQLKAAGWKVITIAGGSHYQEDGLPDRWMSHIDVGGLWVEFKGPKTRIQPIQMKQHVDINKRGGIALFVRFIDDELLCVMRYRFLRCECSATPDGFMDVLSKMRES